MARFLSLACLALLGIGTTHALTVAERDTLVAFYNSANKANALIWNITDEPCRWYGISCTTNTGIKFREQTTDTCIWNQDTCPHTDFHVTQIEMYGDILAGTLPSSLSALSYLRVFTLNFQPRLTGSLPPFTSHPNLYHLEVVETGITGEIPEINPRNDNGVPPANYTKIVLSSNKFTGISSAAVEAGRLNKNAEGFALIDYSSNNGWMSNPNVIMQVAASLPSTVEVFLCKKCGLTGSIPTGAAQRLSKLREIDASDNQISGSLAPLLHPTDPRLEVVRFDNNPLANNITIVFQSLPNTVKSISFYNCSLIGELTPLTNRLQNLTYLDLRYNNIQFGSSSTVFAKHSALGRVNLGNNPLNIDVMTLFNALPSPISNLTIFSCRNCGLTSSLSASISNLPVIATLQEVALSSNSISGSFVPLFHPTRSNLIQLELDHNQLDTAITSPLPFSSIRNLDLSHNKIPDTAPIITGSSLLNLDLSFNKFTGRMPDMSNHTSLQSLILSSNQFTEFPTVTPPSSLRILAVDNNMIATSLPSWLISNPVNVTTFPLLSSLLLNNNFLIGNISHLCDSNVGVAPSLFEIDVSHNKFTGSIPPLDQCNSLQQFHATNNQLTGPLPSINYIFTTLDVNLNSLSGAFPVWNADYLQRLNIACNTFAPVSTPIDQIMLITPNAYIEQDCYDAGVGTNTQSSCTQRCTRPAIGPTLSPPPTSSPPTKKPTTPPQPTPSGGTNNNNNNTSSSSTGNGMGTSTGQPNNNSNGASIIHTSITTVLMTVAVVLSMIIH